MRPPPPAAPAARTWAVGQDRRTYQAVAGETSVARDAQCTAQWHGTTDSGSVTQVAQRYSRTVQCPERPIRDRSPEKDAVHCLQVVACRWLRSVQWHSDTV
eukprot:427440-Pyramimonas_sp.AAC.1